MTKYFNVAGHVFSLTLPDVSPLWDRLGQYAPFQAETGEAIFGLELSDALPVEERTLLFEPDPEPGETLIRIFRTDSGHLVEMAPCSSAPVTARLWMSSDYAQGRLQFLTEPERDAVFSINNSLMLLYAFRTAGLYTLEMHASVIRCDGRAFLFLAGSGTGKSTHSRLWLENVPGSELLNDDNPIVRFFPSDGSVVCYGSPWSGKTPCYRNESAPVGAFVRIRRCPENRIDRLDVFNAYALLYSSSSGLKCDRQMGDSFHETFSSIVSSVPCFVLDCTPDERAALVCSEAVL